ncbi:hypothetical protein GCM10010363_72900 [Streptomyces omiyaensis]|nr:hypothetical protein GCM10010363_72900 [Streptomyces omiyaensis]
MKHTAGHIRTAVRKAQAGHPGLLGGSRPGTPAAVRAGIVRPLRPVLDGAFARLAEPTEQGGSGARMPRPGKGGASTA